MASCIRPQTRRVATGLMAPHTFSFPAVRQPELVAEQSGRSLRCFTRPVAKEA